MDTLKRSTEQVVVIPDRDMMYSDVQESTSVASAGITATAGYTGTIINWGNPGHVKDDIQKEYCKQNPTNCKEDEVNPCE